MSDELSPEEQAEAAAFWRSHKVELQAMFPEWDGESDFNTFMDNRTYYGWSVGRLYWSPLVPALLVERAKALLDGLNGRSNAAKPAPPDAKRKDASVRWWVDAVTWALVGGVSLWIASLLAGPLGAPLATGAILALLMGWGFTTLSDRIAGIAASPQPAQGDWTAEDQRMAVRAYWGDLANSEMQDLMRAGHWNPNVEPLSEFESRVFGDEEWAGRAQRRWLEFKARAIRAVELADAWDAMSRARGIEKDREQVAISEARAIIHERKVPFTVGMGWRTEDYSPKCVRWQELSNADLGKALSALGPAKITESER